MTKKLIPIAQWNKFHVWPTPAGLRYLVVNAKINGFHKAIRRVGRRILIDEAAFFDWVEEQNTPTAS